jgi:hypothetical protein
MIYFHLDVPDEGVHLCRRDTQADDLQHPAPLRIIFKCHVPILTTFSAVCSEALNVMYQHTNFNIYFHNKETKSVGDQERDDLALTRFRELRLTVFLGRNYSYNTFQDASNLQTFFSRVRSLLANRTDNGVINLRIEFLDRSALRFVGLEIFRRATIWDTFDPSHKFEGSNKRELVKEVEAAWCRAHTRELVTRWRSELQFQAPNVKLETNAERDGFEVRVKRVSSTLVHFKVSGARIQGRIGIFPHRDKRLIYSLTPGWDDSDLGTYV